MERVTRALLAALMLIAAPRETRAYSVLAHEANIDALWEPAIRPLLQRRFPHATREELQTARAYAYGGSVVQDLGYYPFGSHFFSNLLHYVRTGDFVETIIRDAQDLDEYAFALGTLAHYTADNVGHPEAVNKAVALMFPKLRAKYGDRVTYVDSPSSHIIVEFSFDIVQVAAGAYLPEAYHSFIGFEVAKPLLERAFRETYGLEMKDVFGDEDLAISTYRHSVSEIIPELTRVAWRDKREEIERLIPGVKESAFIYSYTRQQYEKDFGGAYRKPGLFARFIGFIYKLVPKIGPLKPLSFKAPTPESETLFAESFKDTRARYAAALDQVGRGRLNVTNTNFDLGKPTSHGEYKLADDTYAELVHRLSDVKAAVPPALRADITRYYEHDGARAAKIGSKEQKRAEKVRRQLASMQ
jgi:zinc dependent phospholipase C